MEKKVTKHEILNELNMGSRVAHKYFTSDEWMERRGHFYYFEDGCVSEIEDFWVSRKGELWEHGWSVVKS